MQGKQPSVCFVLSTFMMQHKRAAFTVSLSLTRISKKLIRKKMSVLLMILSVILVVSTLTGSTNNYYNGKILTTILMDNIPVSIIYTINNKNLLIIMEGHTQIVVSSVILY